MMVDAAYFGCALMPTQRNDLVKAITKFLKKSNLDFTHIAARGMSGMSMAPIIAYTMDKGLIVVRKDTKDHHSYLKVEGIPIENTLDLRYIIIDDFIDSGNTIRQIMDEINYKVENECLGVITYGDTYNVSFTEMNTKYAMNGRVAYNVYNPAKIIKHHKLLAAFSHRGD